MKIYWIWFACLPTAALILALGCGHSLPIVTGSGKVIEQEFDVTSFDELEIEAVVKVLVHQGDEPELVIRASDNLFDYIIAEQKENTVYVSLRPKVHYRNADVVAEITVPDLRSVKIRGGAVAEFDSLSTESLDVNVQGAAKVTGDIAVKNLSIDVSGAAKVVLNAPPDALAETVKIEASGAATMDLTALPAKEVSIDASGAGKFRVHATETLEASLSGACALYYAGHPKTVKPRTSGAVIIRAIDEKD